MPRGKWHRPEEIPTFIDEIGQRQRNIVWPDPLVNSRGIDAFLWKGAERPTRVQRIGAWLIGLFELGLGLQGLIWAIEKRSFLFGLVSIVVLIMGARSFRAGFRVHQDRRSHRD